MESLRYRQRVEHLERELQELQDSLNAEREKVQVWLSLCLRCREVEGCSRCYAFCHCCLCSRIFEESEPFEMSLVSNQIESLVWDPVKQWQY